MTSEDRKQKFCDFYTTLIATDGFLLMLKLRASGSLSRFSLGNIMSLMAQAEWTKRPIPSLLKTYKGWLKLERQVQRGEKCWDVLAPNKFTRIDEDTGLARSYLSGFHWLKEFDVSQTEGEPLPEEPADLESEDQLENLLRLQDYAHEQGLTIIYEDTGAAHGWYSKDKQEISLKQGLSPDELFNTLVHELCHWQGVDYQAYSRADAECIVEAAASIVCMGVGLTQTAQSASYVAYWSGQAPEHVLALLDLAEKQAKTLEVALGKRLKYKAAA